MKTSKITETEVDRIERSSRRFQHGVEIIERETMRTVRVNEDPIADGATAAAPRLVIHDTLSAAKVFIAKAHSEFSELNAFLRNAIGPNRRPT